MSRKQNWLSLNTILGFVVLASLIYGSFVVGNWLSAQLGLGAWGIWGTLLLMSIPILIVFVLLRTWLKKIIMG